MTVDVNIGTNFDLIYTIKDQDGNIVDLTGGTIDWDMIDNGKNTVVVSKTGVLTDAVNGVTTVSLVPADTTSLRGLYEIYGQLTDSGANIYRFDAQGIRLK